MKIIYESASFTFYCGNTTYNVRWDGAKPPYDVNIFRGGTYQITFTSIFNPNKSNSRDILSNYLENYNGDPKHLD